MFFSETDLFPSDFNRKKSSLYSAELQNCLNFKFSDL